MARAGVTPAFALRGYRRPDDKGKADLPASLRGSGLRSPAAATDDVAVSRASTAENQTLHRRGLNVKRRLSDAFDGPCIPPRPPRIRRSAGLSQGPDAMAQAIAAAARTPNDGPSDGAALLLGSGRCRVGLLLRRRGGPVGVVWAMGSAHERVAGLGVRWAVFSERADESGLSWAVLLSRCARIVV
jgi:hypothetical protein